MRTACSPTSHSWTGSPARHKTPSTQPGTNKQIRRIALKWPPTEQKKLSFRCCSIYIISSSLSHLISKTLHQKLYFLKCFFSTEQQHSFGEKSKDFSRSPKKISHYFLPCLTSLWLIWERDDKLYSTNHLNSTKVSWYFQKILSLAHT